jgi:hypothetical protein
VRGCDRQQEDEHGDEQGAAQHWAEFPDRRAPRAPVRACTLRRLPRIGLLDRLLAKGRFPADVRAELERERIVLLGEALQATVRGKQLKAAGLPKGRALAAFALTQQRLVLYVMGDPVIDVTWDEGLATELDLQAVEQGLEIGYDAARFAEGHSGRVDILLRLPDPAGVVAAIEQRRKPLDPQRHLRNRDSD